ncbi:DUF2207 domain-containing protein [Methanolacinia petrolearia]|uniref:DUF2207 domain-containing protein n=1 Tax=Methanolacinia petrolearia TaxID=54120 RepID=UPI003BAB6238
MEEKTPIAAVFIVTLIIGIIAIFGPGLVGSDLTGFADDLVADSYEVTCYENGTLTERYVYDVRISGDYRMLYRVWSASLYSAENSQNIPISSRIELTDRANRDDGTRRDGRIHQDQKRRSLSLQLR